MHRRAPMLILGFLLSMALPARAQNKNEQSAPSRPVDGAGIFRSYCASCHGTDGHGDGPVAKALRSAVPDLTKLSQRNNRVFPAAHVRNIILFGADNLLPAHGSTAMPIWGPVFHEIEYDRDLGNVRLENVLKYLESIQHK